MTRAHSAFRGAGSQTRKAKCFGGQPLAGDGGLNPVRDRGWQHFWPLRHGLRSDPDLTSGRRVVPTEELDCGRLVHAELKHACSTSASMLASNESKLAHMDSFGERLKHALSIRGVERKALAGALGVSVQAVSHILNSPTAAMTAANTAQASKFLGVSWFWLATGDGNPDEVEMRVTAQESKLLADVHDIAAINPETGERLVLEIKRIADGLRSTDTLLRTHHGVTSYVSPQRAAEQLGVPASTEARPSVPDRALGGISGFADLDEAPPVKKEVRRK